MEDEYIKETKIIEKNEQEKNMEILKSIAYAKKNLEQASKNFEFAEGDLIDYYSYKIKANQSKLDYLIKLAKSRGMIMTPNLQINFDSRSSEAG